MVLVGGGHAHLHVLQSLRSRHWPEVRTILISPTDEHTYSGMVPGYLHGRYAINELTVDLRRLCDSVGAELVLATAERVDQSARTVETSGGPIPFTIASLDIGSVPAGLDLPGVREHALMLRPMTAAVRLRERLDAAAGGAAVQGEFRDDGEGVSGDGEEGREGGDSVPAGAAGVRESGKSVPGDAEGVEPMPESGESVPGDSGSGENAPVNGERVGHVRTASDGKGLGTAGVGLGDGSTELRVAVVGGGAGGVEVTLAVQARLRSHDGRGEVVLLERSGAILEGFPGRARRRMEWLIRSAGGNILTHGEVTAVRADGVELKDGRFVAADLVIWLSGAAPPPLLGASKLPLSRDGYFAVDAHLRSVDGAPIWGAGDCISFAGQQLPKAGVYAVREAPILAANLRAALSGGAPTRYQPQKTALALLNTADGAALLRWRGLTLHNRAAWWLKDRIDRRFVARYNLPR